MITFEMKETKAVLSMIGFELFGNAMTADFDGLDWRKVYWIANAHAVTPLLYSSIKQIPGADAGIFDAVERYAVRATVLTERMGKIQAEIFQRLNKENIRAAVLKGTSAAAFYPHPEVRMTGDIDILIDGENMDALFNILKGEGFSFEGRGELHASFKKGSAVIEVHDKVSRYPATPKGRYAESRMACALNEIGMHRIGMHSFPMLSDADRLVSLLSHMERHMGASGIGLRQLCDWAVSVQGIDLGKTTEIKDVLDKCGLLTFAQILTGACEKYLGMPECGWLDDVSEEMKDEAMAEILSVGNFQAQYKNRPLASALIEPYDIDGDGKRKLVKTYLRRVKKKMQNEVSWAKSSFWTPFFAVYYFVRWAFSMLKGNTDRRGMLNTLKTSREREKFLRKLCLYK